MKEWLIIDGYNLIHQIFPDDRNGNLACLEKNRKKLLTLLEPLVNVLARRITVVFDGQSDKTQNNQKESEVIDVVYSPPHLSADTVIENLVWKVKLSAASRGASVVAEPSGTPPKPTRLRPLGPPLARLRKASFAEVALPFTPVASASARKLRRDKSHGALWRRRADRPEDILVVTSDRLERDGASASGADTMASSLFISMLKDEQCRLSTKIKQMNKKHENVTLGDFYPKP